MTVHNYEGAGELSELVDTVAQIGPMSSSTFTWASVLIEGTPPPFNISVCQTPYPAGDAEYTDEQFHADLKKAKKTLDRMEKAALREDQAGKTRRFP